MEATDVFAPQQNETTSILRKLAGLFDRLVELDFTGVLPFVVLAVGYIGSRLYFLDQGYGTDPDAWRVALTAEYLWDKGTYLPSRLPGYPLHEFVTTALIKGGWIATNLSTVLVSLAGVYLFAWLARRLELPNKGALTLGFAFAPLLWINSVTTMDYMWALTFMMGAYLALLYGAPGIAGISLGLAGGFRITSLFMLVPFAIMLWRTGQRNQIRPLIVTSGIVTLAAFTPVLLKYGINFMNFYDQPVPLEEFVKRLGKDGLGIIGSLAVLGGLALSWRQLARYPRDLLHDTQVLVWTSVIAIYVLSYTRLPHEIAYLIPLFPFGFFLMSRYMSRMVLIGVLGLIVLAGFVDITTPKDTIGIDSSTFTDARVGHGMVLSDIDTLQNQMDFARELRTMTITNENINKPAIVMTGFIYPEFVVLYYDDLKVGILENDIEAISQLSDKGLASDIQRSIDYVWLLDYEDFKYYQDASTIVYYTADAARSTIAVDGYRPGFYGAIELPLSRENPSLGSGSATTDR